MRIFWSLVFGFFIFGQISFDKIPTLDRDSAEYLSDRQMGTLSDMVSQFEYSDDSTDGA